MIRFSQAAASDTQFLKLVQLPKGSLIVFDKGYFDYKTYHRFTDRQITWVTRLKSRLVYQQIQGRPVSDAHQQSGILSDQKINMGLGVLEI